MSPGVDQVEAYYSPGGLLAKIIAGLEAAGKTGAVSPDDLAGVDQFHIGCKQATLDLLRLGSVTTSTRVLDVGGPARTIAAAVGCSVTVLDLTEEFCITGAELTRRTGLGPLVTFRHGNALDMPFDDGTFDVAWTQHSSMNIADKEELYAEIHRVLRPGGTLLTHEIMAGANAPPHFPVPWANMPEISHLRAPEQMRTVIAAAGFREVQWQNITDEALTWWHARVAAAANATAPVLIGLHLLLGPAAPEITRNTVRSLGERRIAVVRAAFRRV